MDGNLHVDAQGHNFTPGAMVEIHVYAPGYPSPTVYTTTATSDGYSAYLTGKFTHRTPDTYCP
jgi:hypothetical protein